MLHAELMGGRGRRPGVGEARTMVIPAPKGIQLDRVYGLLYGYL